MVRQFSDHGCGHYLSGFLEAESFHGLRYTKIIADGDSSVYPKLQENIHG
jgi:hypothetical protein